MSEPIHPVRPLYIRYAGPVLLETPLLNKGSAFTQEERHYFNIEGLLPHNIETIEEQEQRAYQQLGGFSNDLDKHIYLRNIQDTNETLYFRLVTNHLDEIMPLIYTPTVGQACEQFSKIYRRKRGLFISYPDIDRIDDMLQNATKQNVKVIVVTDGERILGLGDQGIGGMGIPVGKLALYTACGGISPAYTLPVVLDVGCNNPTLIEDPMYMGWRNPRISGQQYTDFVEKFIDAVKRRWPEVLLQFEDFAQNNATPLLERYRDELCCFNDDIQGTAAVTVGTLLAAAKVKGEKLSEQRVCFVGAGSAGCGIAEQIIKAMISEGLDDAQARSQIFMVDRYGLLFDDMANLLPFQLRLAHTSKLREQWQCEQGDLSLAEVIPLVKPTVLIGVSGQPGLFSQAIIESLCEYVPQPVILPLSNPTSRVEGRPVDMINWSKGLAIVATGSPFPIVDYEGTLMPIAQCNNSYIFPGIGLGVLAARAKRITDNMLMSASRAFADQSPLASAGSGGLLPDLKDIRELSRVVARAVAKQAMIDGVATELPDDALDRRIERNFWKPEYREYRRTSF
ncbi:MAG: malate dehydrogenase (oxaloacetate-decarboxylating) [Flavobacteriales bacterium]|jgi:malate dehydrogenase (oxaloacetate-decarboxylating)